MILYWNVRWEQLVCIEKESWRDKQRPQKRAKGEYQGFVRWVAADSQSEGQKDKLHVRDFQEISQNRINFGKPLVSSPSYMHCILTVSLSFILQNAFFVFYWTHKNPPAQIVFGYL